MFLIDHNIIRKLSSFWFFDRWHPEVALRYLPIVEVINKYPKDFSVLDVGSGGLGIAPYLKRKVIGLDIHFKPPFCENLIHKEGSILKIPFGNNSYDFVTCVDMLEHIHPRERKKAISELIRVAKKKVYIAVPCGKKSQSQDEQLEKYYQKIFKEKYHFLDEQIEYGLPEKKEIFDIITTVSKEFKKNVTVTMVGNENLKLREFLMKGWITKNIIMNIFFRKIALILIPLMRIYNQEPYYRIIFNISIHNENSN
jgi:SAM-dependent methyltransferase